MDPHPHTFPLNRDIQNETDDRGVHIGQVGISDLKLPLLLGGVARDPAHRQTVAALCSLAVDLRPDFKGIHMSRLVEDLVAPRDGLDFDALRDLARRLRAHQEAERSFLSLAFDWFLDRRAPVSGRVAPQAYRCRFASTLEGDVYEFRQSVEVPVTTLCPCSKEISAYGAHNQRGYVEVELVHRFPELSPATLSICLEEIIELVESAASAPLYPILKRTDERFVTMQAFDQPRFVEDMVRGVAVKLRGDTRMDAWRVQVTNHESIHQHNAFARVASPGFRT